MGLNTFADPRKGGGKLNKITKEDLVKLIEIEGQERLLYKAFPIDAVFLRGSYADEYGNCTVCLLYTSFFQIGRIQFLYSVRPCKGPAQTKAVGQRPVNCFHMADPFFDQIQRFLN